MNWLLVFGLLGIALGGWYLYSKGAFTSLGLPAPGKVVAGSGPPPLPPPGHAEGGVAPVLGGKTGYQPPPRQPVASLAKLTVVPSVGPTLSARGGKGHF